MIWVFGIWSFFQKWLDNLWFVWVFETHLSTYGIFFLAMVVSRLSCSFVINLRRLRMAPLWVPVGQLANQYGVGRAI